MYFRMKQQGRLNSQFDEYQEAASDFAQPIMAHLRKLVHKQCPEVVEEIKWGNPHFDYKGEMLCIFAAYKNPDSRHSSAQPDIAHAMSQVQSKMTSSTSGVSHGHEPGAVPARSVDG